MGTSQREAPKPAFRSMGMSTEVKETLAEAEDAAQTRDAETAGTKSGNRSADAVVDLAKAAMTLDERAAAMTAWRGLPPDARALTSKLIAKALGITVADLRGSLKGKREESEELVKAHEPNPHPVEGAALATELEEMFARYVYLPPHGATALALWTLSSHAVPLDAFDIAPYLNLSSPVRRCGKSTTMDLLEAAVGRPVMCSGASAPTLFRMIDASRPTVLIDETDKVFAKAKDNPDLVAALNAGHRRGGSILRCVGDENAVKRFDCFASYALAGIGTLPDTIADRSIPVPLSRKPPGVKLARRGIGWRADVWAKGERAARWVADNLGLLTVLAHEAPRPGFLDDRAADTWAPLFAIAKALGGDWPRKAWDAARALSGSRDESDDSAAARILRDCRLAFGADSDGNTADRPHDRLPTSELLRGLKDIPESPWGTWNRGHGLDDRGLARLLKPYGIRAKTIRSGSATPRGYERAAFLAAWDAYCGGADDATDEYANEWARWTAGACESRTGSQPPEPGPNCATTAKNAANPCCIPETNEADAATTKPSDSSVCCTVSLSDIGAIGLLEADADEGITI